MVCPSQSGLGLLLFVSLFCVNVASPRIARPVNFYYGNSGPGDLQVSAAEINEDTQPFEPSRVPPVVFPSVVSVAAAASAPASAPSAAGSEIVEKVVKQPKGFAASKPTEDSKTAESLIQKFEEKLKKGKTIADAPTIIADPPASASSPQKRQVKSKSTLQSSPIVVLDESPASYARRVHKMEPVVPQLAQDSEQHQARVAPPKAVVKKRRNGAKGEQQDGKQSESKVQEQTAQGSDHHDHHEKNEHHEHGGGKKHHDEHHGVKGDKGHKAYKGHHDYSKVEHGHHDKEGHKGHYVDEGGHKKKHHDEHDHHHEHHEGEEGDKGAKVGIKTFFPILDSY